MTRMSLRDTDTWQPDGNASSTTPHFRFVLGSSYSSPPHLYAAFHLLIDPPLPRSILTIHTPFLFLTTKFSFQHGV